VAESCRSKEPGPDSHGNGTCASTTYECIAPAAGDCACMRMHQTNAFQPHVKMAMQPLAILLQTLVPLDAVIFQLLDD